MQVGAIHAIHLCIGFFVNNTCNGSNFRVKMKHSWATNHTGLFLPLMSKCPPHPPSPIQTQLEVGWESKPSLEGCFTHSFLWSYIRKVPKALHACMCVSLGGAPPRIRAAQDRSRPAPLLQWNFFLRTCIFFCLFAGTVSAPFVLGRTKSWSLSNSTCTRNTPNPARVTA